MQRRLRLLRTVMADADVDVALLTSYHNVKYYSDFLYTSFGRSYALIVTQDEAITVSANIDGGMPWRRSVDGNIVYTDWQRDNFVDRKSTRLNSSHVASSYAVFCLTKE